MTAATWFLPSILALGLWGISMFLPKLALRTLPPLHLTVYSSVFFFVAATGMLGVYGFELDFDPKGIFLAVVVGVLGTIAQVLYVFAIRTGPMTYGAVISSLYPVVAALLAFLVLDESLNLRQTAGIFLGICSVILMVVAYDDKAKE